MKEIIIGSLLLFAIGTGASAQTDTSASSKTMSNTASNQPAKYWYYPVQDVYQNETTNEYWYYNTPENKWISSKKLPDSYDMSASKDRHEIIYTGSDVWKENKTHKTKFKVKADGTIKQKSDPAKP